MARIQPGAGIKQITGLIDKKVRIVSRVKIYRDPLTGDILGYGPNEYYIQKVSTIPRTDNQKLASQRFTVINKMMKEIIANKNHPRYQELYSLYLKQIHNEKSIKRFQNFICSILYKEAL